MGMLIRRHREGIDAAREVEPTEENPTLPTPPLVAGETGVPTDGTNETVVPTGEVPAQPVDPPTGEDAVAEGTPGGAENVEDPQGAYEGQTTDEVVGEAPVASETPSDAPGRNASTAVWREYLGVDDSDPRSRDELAESVLGPKQ